MEDVKYFIEKKNNMYTIHFKGVDSAITVEVNGGTYNIRVSIGEQADCDGTVKFFDEVSLDSGILSVYLTRHLLFYTIRYYSEVISGGEFILSNNSTLEIMQQLGIDDYVLEDLFFMEKVAIDNSKDYTYGLNFLRGFRVINRFSYAKKYDYGIILNSALAGCFNMGLFLDGNLIDKSIIKLLEMYFYCEGIGNFIR